MIGIFPFPRVIVAYAVWLLTLALSAGLFLVWRSALLQLYLRARLDKWAFRAFDDVVAVLLGLAWLVLAIVTEDWLRRSANAGRLRRVAVSFLAVEVGALAVGYLIYLWA